MLATDVHAEVNQRNDATSVTIPEVTVDLAELFAPRFRNQCRPGAAGDDSS